jgi:hypothetical protein
LPSSGYRRCSGFNNAVRATTPPLTRQPEVSNDGLRHFACGYALAGVSGNACENGRTTRYVVAKDMTAAIDACVDVQPADRDYFCCVLASDGAEPADQSQCEAAPSLGPHKLAPAWRPGRSCCRFEGETTCPPL